MTTQADLAEIAEDIVAMAQRCGYVEIREVPPSIELVARRTFAVVTLGRRSVRLRLKMPIGRRIPGLVRFFTGTADTKTHTLRIRSAADLDEEVAGWLCEAHAAAQGAD